MTINSSSQRWVCRKYQKSTQIPAQFFELDQFIRSFPRVQLETNEYILTTYAGEWICARRITGFIDQLPDQFFCLDLLIGANAVDEENLWERPAKLTELEQVLEQGCPSGNNFRPYFEIKAKEHKEAHSLELDLVERLPTINI